MLMQPFVSILTLPSTRLLLVFLQQGLAGLSLSLPLYLSLSILAASLMRSDRHRHGEDGRAVMWAYYSRSSCTGSAVNPPFPCTSSCPPSIPLWRSPSTSRLSLPPVPPFISFPLSIPVCHIEAESYEEPAAAAAVCKHLCCVHGESCSQS